jgi:ribosome-binding factor A
VIASQLLKASDPRFFLVTITSVVVTGDLRSAKVYWMVSGGKDRIPEVEEAFASATGLFKRAIAKDIGMKFVPDLRFFYDNTLDTNEEVERLFDRVKHE